MGISETIQASPEHERGDQTAPGQYEYDVWLLDDHPLRSHPTECIPGLETFLSEWSTSLQHRWKETLFRAGCLLLVCLAAFQCLHLLHSPSTGKGLPRPRVASRINPREWHVRCTYPHSDPRSNALTQAVAASCDGLRTDLWLRDNELQMGPSDLGSGANNALRLHLDSIIAKLESDHASRSSQASLSVASGGLNHNDPSRTFMLVLDAGSSLPEVLPSLVLQMEVLRERGYLSHWAGAGVVQRPITVVVTGTALPNSDCSGFSYSDVFWTSEERLISATDFAHGQLSPICVV